MKLTEFKVETWMTEYEHRCLYNLTDTSMPSYTIEELENVLDLPIQKTLGSFPCDYGSILGSKELKEAIISLYKRGDSSHLTITNGVVNANQHVMDTLLNRGDNVISFTPSYEQYYTYPKSIGCTYTLVKLKEDNHWLPDMKDIKNAINDHTKMIIINNPSNPTGTYYDEKFLKELINLVKDKDIYILSDEIFQGFHDYISISDMYEKGITTCGLSKVYGFAGLRIGWIKAQPSIIEKIVLRRDYTMISTGPYNDYLASIILSHKDKVLEKQRVLLDKNKKIVKSLLDDSFTCQLPVDGTVCFLHYHKDIPSKDLCKILLEKYGLFFVPGALFGCEYHLRLGLTNTPENIEKGLNILKNYLTHEHR